MMDETEGRRAARWYVLSVVKSTNGEWRADEPLLKLPILWHHLSNGVNGLLPRDTTGIFGLAVHKRGQLAPHSLSPSALHTHLLVHSFEKVVARHG